MADGDDGTITIASKAGFTATLSKLTQHVSSLRDQKSKSGDVTAALTKAAGTSSSGDTGDIGDILGGGSSDSTSSAVAPAYKDTVTAMGKAMGNVQTRIGNAADSLEAIVSELQTWYDQMTGSDDSHANDINQIQT